MKRSRRNIQSVQLFISFRVNHFWAEVPCPSTKEVIYALAQQDMVALRIVMRLGWEVPNPINSLKPKEAERFPFAILKSGS